MNYRYEQSGNTVSDTLSLTEWREDCAIVRVRFGNGQIIIDGDKHSARDGDYFVLRPFVLYSFHSDGNPFAAELFVFNARSLAGSGGEYDIGDFLHFINEKNVPCAVSASTEWYEAFDGVADKLFRDADEQTKTKALYETLSLLYDKRFVAAEFNVTEEKQRYAVKTILDVIRSEYYKTIGVSRVAQTIGYDEFYTMKLFKRFTGLPLVEYINRYRIKLACGFLTANCKDISEIAYETGFSNVSYFNRQFKRLTGVTPSVYRLTAAGK